MLLHTSQNPIKIAKHLKHVNFKLSGISDNEIKLLADTVKTIETLDLEGTSVSNLSIQYLANLESIKELRLTNCYEIDDGCLRYLNQLNTLEFLYTNGTDITIKGILNCSNFQNLKSINISSAGSEHLSEDLFQWKQSFPNCKLVVNDIYYKL